ncbi:MAG: hypothetical protein WC471_00635 [Candidatus Woesearchaeota archaeon]
MNKKALSLPITYIMVLIICLVTLIVLIMFQSSIINLIKSTTTDNACKASVYLQSKLQLEGKNFIETGNLECPTRVIELTKEAQIKPTIANELYSCWDNFGQGKWEIFKADSQTYCVICSNIQFKGLEGRLPGIIKYLANTKIPGESQTYFEGLNGVRFNENTISSFDNFITPEFDYIDLTKPLSIVFVYSKRAAESKLSSTFQGIIGSTPLGMVSGTVVGLYTWSSLAGVTILGFGVPAVTLGMTAAAGTITAMAIAGGAIGYMLGSTSSANWYAHVMAVPFDKDNIDKLGCTYMPVRGEVINVKE